MGKGRPSAHGGGKYGPSEPPPVSSEHDNPVFKFESAVTKGPYCAHKWGKDDIKELVSFFKKVEKRTWQQIKKTGGGTGNKSGLGHTPVKASQLPGKGKNLSPDVRSKVFELRVSGQRRVFCFQEGRVCNIVWFDKNHKIT